MVSVCRGRLFLHKFVKQACVSFGFLPLCLLASFPQPGTSTSSLHTDLPCWIVVAGKKPRVVKSLTHNAEKVMKTKSTGILIQNPKEERKVLKTYGQYNDNDNVLERLFGCRPFLAFPSFPQYNLAG